MIIVVFYLLVYLPLRGFEHNTVWYVENWKLQLNRLFP